MGSEALEDAASSLRDAAAAAESDEARERLENQAGEFASLADADRGPDHGKLARHEHILAEIADADPAAADDIEDALASIRSYRETLEGV